MKEIKLTHKADGHSSETLTGYSLCVSRQCKKDRATLKVDIKNVNLRLKKELK